MSDAPLQTQVHAESLQEITPPPSPMERFRNQHHLVNHEKRFIYCYIAKNACSTLKFQFLKATLPPVEFDAKEANRNVHSLVRAFSLDTVHVRDLSVYRAFVVVRHPMARLVSAFFEKFVTLGPTPAYCHDLVAQSGIDKTLEAFTFGDFVNAVLSVPEDALNEHWMPQHRHLIPGLSYDLIDMATIASHPAINEFLGAIPGNVRPHATSYGESVRDAELLTVTELRRSYEQDRRLPSIASFMSVRLVSRTYERFGEDQRLIWDARHAVPPAPA